MNDLTPYVVPPESVDAELDSLVADILLNLGGLGAGFSAELCSELSSSLEAINSFYSNRMEGNPTKIGDVFDAIDGNIEGSQEERNFKLEHKSHVLTSGRLRKLIAEESYLSPSDTKVVSLVHKTFFEAIPESFRKAKTHSGKEVDIIPGSFRERPVTVGRFYPPDPKDVPELLEKFNQAYDIRKFDSKEKLLAIAGAHHRFLYIHPFSDGNGRVARLITELMLIVAGFDGNGLFSVSRGLASDISSYNKALQSGDSERRYATDGRGPRSLEGLIFFTKYFLSILKDQIIFMKTILSRVVLESRLQDFVLLQSSLKRLSDREVSVIEYLFHFGSMARGDVKKVSGLKERQAGIVIRSLLEKGFLRTPSPKGRLYFILQKDLRIYLLKEFFEAE